MSTSSITSLKIRAKLYQKMKRKQGKEILLKDAFKELSKKAGYPSWKAYKDAYDLADLLNPPKWSAHWKIWFASSNEGRKHLTPDHYLLPYLKQAFICDSYYISALGIDPSDPDLAHVGNDFTRPHNENAFKRLLMKIRSTHQL